MQNAEAYNFGKMYSFFMPLTVIDDVMYSDTQKTVQKKNPTINISETNVKQGKESGLKSWKIAILQGFKPLLIFRRSIITYRRMV